MGEPLTDEQMVYVRRVAAWFEAVADAWEPIADYLDDLAGELEVFEKVHEELVRRW